MQSARGLHEEKTLRMVVSLGDGTSGVRVPLSFVRGAKSSGHLGRQ